MHTNENDAIVAIENYLGPTGSTSSGTITGQLNNLTSVVSGASGGAAVSGSFLTVTVLSGTAARTFTLGAGLSGTDAGSGSTYTTRIYPTGVASGTYYKPTVTVNAQGQLTFASTNGDASGFVQGVPLMSRTVAACNFAAHVSGTDRVYFTTFVATGSWYYIDRIMDYPVQLGVFSGRAPNTWIYMPVTTTVLHAATNNIAFTATVTGGIVITGIAALGIQGGCAIRTSVSGKTVYTSGRGNPYIYAYDPVANSVIATITGNGLFPGQGGRSVAYVSGVEYVYVQHVNSDISVVACATNTLTATISGVGLNLSSDASLTYHLGANKVFCCGTNAAANKTWYFTPTTGTHTLSTLDFPAGFQGSNGAEGCYTFGDYVYFSTNAANPSVVLVLDPLTLTWKHPLGITDNTATTMANAPFMAGVLNEGVLYLGNSVSGFYTYGRL